MCFYDKLYIHSLFLLRVFWWGLFQGHSNVPDCGFLEFWVVFPEHFSRVHICGALDVGLGQHAHHGD